MRVESLKTTFLGAKVDITVLDSGVPPVIASDTISIEAGQASYDSRIVGVPLYRNDSLANEDGEFYDPVLGIEIGERRRNGSLGRIMRPGTFSYRSRHFFGTTSFTYRIRDKDGFSEPALVSVRRSTDLTLRLYSSGPLHGGIYAAYRTTSIPANLGRPLTASLSVNNSESAGIFCFPTAPGDSELKVTVGHASTGSIDFQWQAGFQGDWLSGAAVSVQRLNFPLAFLESIDPSVGVDFSVNVIPREYASPFGGAAPDLGSAFDLDPLFERQPVCGIQRAAVYGIRPTGATSYYRFSLRDGERVAVVADESQNARLLDTQGQVVQSGGAGGRMNLYTDATADALQIFTTSNLMRSYRRSI
ncbi:MAG: Ig-like domain-containing protein [Verrucomicrobiales bacterium]